MPQIMFNYYFGLASDTLICSRSFLNPKPNAEALSAMLETEQILEECNSGARMPRGFVNAREIFAAMDDQ